jgi:outer membrane protein
VKVAGALNFQWVRPFNLINGGNIMINRIIIFASFFCFFTTAFASAADVAKLGVVDFQKIIQSSSAGKEAQAKINEKGKEMEKDLKAKGSEIEEIKKKLDRESLVMSKEMRDQKEREFRIKVNDFKALEKKYKAELKETNSKLVLKIQKDVIKLAKEIGKKEGYLLIIEKNTAGILYSPASIEMTDKIIKIYNDQTSAR